MAMATSNPSDVLMSKAEDAMSALQRRGERVVTAESCTGGLIAYCLSKTRGAGEHFEGGFVVYSKNQKHESLGVPPLVLKADGAVSDATVQFMLRGALINSRADVAVAVTGVVGPSTDEDGSPVGLMFFGVQKRATPPIILRKDYGAMGPDHLREAVAIDALCLLGSTLKN